ISADCPGRAKRGASRLNGGGIRSKAMVKRALLAMVAVVASSGFGGPGLAASTPSVCRNPFGVPDSAITPSIANEALRHSLRAWNSDMAGAGQTRRYQGPSHTA